jgi:hypothetical protein
MTPMPAQAAVDAYFLEARSRLLDVAAMLDRVGRGDGSVASDPRLAKIREAITVLSQDAGGRAEQVQRIFSLPYDPTWPVPKPK